MPERPGPPLRSYTDLVQAEVEQATASLLHPPAPPPTAAQSDTTPPGRRRRSDTVGSSDLKIRRRRSAHGLRLPPGVGEQDEGDVGGQAEESSSGRSAAQASTAGLGEGGGLRPPTLLRRTTSADLLERDDGEDEDEADGFSSEEEPFRYRPPSIASVATSQRSSRQGVRIEDWSDRQSSAFAKDVRIKGYHAVGSEGSGFVVFDIEIDTLPANPSAQGTTIRIHKRYSSFVRLRSDLLRSFPRLRSVVPRLPPKSSFAKYRPSFLDRRRQHLSYWLSCILLHPVLGGCSEMRQWVLE